MTKSQVELAGGASRLVAAIIDGAVLGGLNWLLIRTGAIYSPTSAVVVFSVAYFLYYTIQHGFGGQTLGNASWASR